MARAGCASREANNIIVGDRIQRAVLLFFKENTKIWIENGFMELQIFENCNEVGEKCLEMTLERTTTLYA